MEKIIVLDFSSPDVYVFDFDSNIYSNDNIQDFFDVINDKYNLYLREQDCQWMINKQLTINAM